VRSATIKNFIFSQEEPVLRYDNLLPYSEINPDQFASDLQRSLAQPSPYLIGSQRDTLKIQLIILPQQPYRSTKNVQRSSAR